MLAPSWPSPTTARGFSTRAPIQRTVPIASSFSTILTPANRWIWCKVSCGRPSGHPMTAASLSSRPEAAALFSSQSVNSLPGWVDNHAVLATDTQNAYWLSEDNQQQSVALKDIYGAAFQIMSSNTIRVNPVNPDLLLISADYLSAPAGAPVVSAGSAAGFFLYEPRSKRRVILSPPDQSGRGAEWSRDGLQVFFSGSDSSHRPSTYRIFWDSTGLQRLLTGSNYVIGQ